MFRDLEVAVGTTDAATERVLSYSNNAMLATLKDAETDLTFANSPAGISRKTLVRVCGGTSCAGNAESRTEYTYWNDTALPLTVTVKDEATNAARTTTYSYNSGDTILGSGP